jgi:hypothetical protein
MATQLFTEILQKAPDVTRATNNANMWLREQAMGVRPAAIPNPKSLVTGQSDRLVTALTVGRMYLFMYDPKFKEDLPYYDRFPLVFPFKKVKGGFYGINMHYLPHLLRAKLMDNLYALANNQNNNDTTKLRLSYQILSSASKFRYFEPCVKHYLNSHVKSRFLWIPAEQWDTALFLPLERFAGATKQQVWRDSRLKVSTYNERT